MPLLGYGEHAFALHAITTGLPELFRQLGDPTDPRESIRFFRPSFGRRSSRAGAELARSAFGEFDGIIGSAKAVYLIEAKWTGSGELLGAELELRPEQRRRHVAFRTYLEEWRRIPAGSWDAFAERVAPVLAERTQGLVPPPAGSALARNLEFVLRRLATSGSTIVDVLLFSRTAATQVAPKSCGDFCIMMHPSEQEEGSGFIRLLD